MRWLLVAGWLGLVPDVGSAQEKPGSLPPGVTAAMVAQGKEIYEGSGLCMACHGVDGKGSIGPDLSDSIWVHTKGTFGEIVTQIIDGVSESKTKSGSVMPPRGGAALTDDEVKAVAAYVWTLSRPSRKP